MSEKERIIDLLYNSFYTNLSNQNDDGTESIPVISIALTFRKVLDLMNSSYYQGKVHSLPPFLIIATTLNDGFEAILDTEKFDELLIQNGTIELKNIVAVDLNGNMVNLSVTDDEFLHDLVDVTKLSLKYITYKFIWVEGNTITVLHKGITIHQVPSVLSVQRLRDFSLKIPANDTESILSRYVSYFENVTSQDKFWKTKGKGHLRDSPEILFADDLYSFLLNNIRSGRVDRESYILNTTDRTDVRIITNPDGNVHIYEVKWIGRTETIQKYNLSGAHDRANEGIAQISQYLKERQCKKGILVVYDGRLTVEEIKWLEEAKWDVRIHKPPTILELKKLSASKEAEKIVKGKKEETK
jgi:hypothetical protein